MAFSTGLSIHDDTNHKGSAKRGGVSGVARLNATQQVEDNLKPGILLAKQDAVHEGGHLEIESSDNTTYENNINLDRYGNIIRFFRDVDYGLKNGSGVVQRTLDLSGATNDDQAIQHAGMKGVLNGLAELDAGVHLPVAQLPVAACIVGSGTYTGNDASNRPIAHGLSEVPKLIVIESYYAESGGWSTSTTTIIETWEVNASDRAQVTAMSSTNFYVTAMGVCNTVGYTDRWVAFA